MIENENNLTEEPLAPLQYTTWSSVKGLSTQQIIDVLLSKGVDVRESLEDLHTRGLAPNARVTVKANLEKVWKNSVSGTIINGRNARL
jgi:hypothetical protein